MKELGPWRECAGLKGKQLHDFRRTAVRNLERAGVPRSVAMQLTGHPTESVYMRYDIVDEQDLRDGVERLAKSFGHTLVTPDPKTTPSGAAALVQPTTQDTV